MKVNGHNNIDTLMIQQKRKSVEKDAASEIKDSRKDTVSISQTAEMLNKLKNHPDVRIEKVRMMKQLIEQDQAITRERVRIGIGKMLLEIFSEQTL